MRTTQLTATEAAAIAHTTVRTIRTWCRSGLIHAVKIGGRWAISLGQLARLICAPTDRPRRSEHRPARTGRAARRAEGRQLARATSHEHHIPLYSSHQRARIAAANTGYTTARDYLFDLGMDIDDIEEFESAFGRAVAKVYRANHHAEPDMGGLAVVHGRLRHVARYADIRDLHAGAAQYAVTRALLEQAA